VLLEGLTGQKALSHGKVDLLADLSFYPAIGVRLENAPVPSTVVDEKILPG
jgi:hypothetical protein